MIQPPRALAAPNVKQEARDGLATASDWLNLYDSPEEPLTEEMAMGRVIPLKSKATELAQAGYGVVDNWST